MRVLLNMCYLISRTGAELFVRDVALALNRIGHSVIVYAPVMGNMVDPLRRGSIACVTDLRQVAEAPDIIVGNTQVETAVCLAHFPGVPAISICHDRVSDHGRPPIFSRVRCYVAVDANCAERLTMEHGIPPAKVRIIHNGVDLRRFRPRAPLPDRPRMAAIFSNYATAGGDTDAIRQACAAEGITLDVIGAGAGTQANDPEEILPRYDLVFAKARCAMEAMVVGCAVVVLNQGQGMAGLVESANVAEWHAWNFGRRLLVRNQIQEHSVRAAIQAYSPADAQRVSAYMREHASLDSTVRALDDLIRDVLRSTPESVSPQCENREFAQYIQDLLLAPDPLQAGARIKELIHVVGDAKRALAAANEGLANAQRDLDSARRKLTCTQRKVASMQASLTWRATRPLRWLRRRLKPRGDAQNGA